MQRAGRRIWLEAWRHALAVVGEITCTQSRAFTILIAAVSPSWLAPANFAMLKWAVDIFKTDPVVTDGERVMGIGDPGAADSRSRHYTKTNGLERLGTPEDVARAMSFFLSAHKRKILDP